jgi:hypothetical protein
MDDNTIVIFTTDNGAENFTWPDGGTTRLPWANAVMEGGFQCPAIIRWPGKVPANQITNGIMSAWMVPDPGRNGGNPNITAELLRANNWAIPPTKCTWTATIRPMITGKGPSNRHEIFYFGESALGAVRIDDYKYRFIDSQVAGWALKFQSMYRSDQPATRPVRAHGLAGKPVGTGARNSASTGSSSSSGVSCSCNNRWPNWLKPQSSSRRCKKARASASIRSRPRSQPLGRRWPSNE